ncbi:uncharacterized protein BJ212DRAFT_1588348 [Suillus subaureus]|uniref:Uncharacterized protein n=1 Tax=Suillus subaureus TaxID=48587 RepID=A0A9P7JCG6_9AGAM|nr:uncharacterized protein BJ212DRAFT_1588348 [Suillus subaureus]KAG1814310.1 hypothetical protein BJ212DRAFT_1588348 [Suillus subaureus]
MNRIDPTLQQQHGSVGCRPIMSGLQVIWRHSAVVRSNEDHALILRAIESNLSCKRKSDASLNAKLIRHYLKNDHPTAICNVLPWRVLFASPLGLGLSRDDIARVARMSIDAAFLRPRDGTRFQSRDTGRVTKQDGTPSNL